jgi:hypothetical protein
MKSLRDTAMLASLTMTIWQGRKLDKKVTDDAIANANAEADAGRFNKQLLAKTALAKIRTTVSAGRAQHAYHTAAWQTGARILSGKNHAAYTSAMRKIRVAYWGAVKDFLGEYDSFIAQAKVRLGNMWRASDYPSANEVARYFTFDVEISPLSESTDFRIPDMARGEQDKARMDIAARAEKRLRDSTADVWQRVLTRVAHLGERCTIYDPARAKAAPFRDSAVDGLYAQAEMIPVLNIAGSAALDDVRAAVVNDLCKYTPQELREDSALRADIASKAKALAERMAGGAGAGLAPVKSASAATAAANMSAFVGGAP